MKQVQDIIYSGNLSAISIDEMSNAITSTLSALSLNSKDILKIRLSAEEVMSIWSTELGEDVRCQLVKHKHFGKSSLILQADGKSVDPTHYQDEMLLSVSSNPNMVTALGLPAQYSYTGGRNKLTLHLPSPKPSPIQQVLIAMLSAIILSLIVRYFIPHTGEIIGTQIITPLTDTITRMLQLIAGPLVFLSIVSGISGVGDVSSFGKIGSTLAKRFFAITFMLAVLIWLSISWLFPITLSGASDGDGSFTKLFSLILDIVPSDIVTPFQTGNAMQIIFIAACVGIGIILLGEVVDETVMVVNQINAIVQLLTIGISKVLPAFIFLCISSLVLTSDFAEMAGIVVPISLIIALNLLIPLFYGLYAARKAKMSPIALFRAQLPSFLTALTTASSAAAFGSNVECCEKKLNMDEKLVRFGIPFGQVLFMPGAAVENIVLSLYMAKHYDISITPVWIVIMIIIASILAIASPPIPGSGLSGMLILFSQLGIPTLGIAFCATVLTFSDYFSTACDIACLQQELLINANKLGLINSDKR